MAGGGSGAYFTTHVRFIVEPLFMKRSGPPVISVIGSVKKGKNREKKLVSYKLLLRVFFSC